MKQKKMSNKHESFCQELRKKLARGKLEPGEQIPAERKLAVQAGISYMTARASVQLLVDEGLLVKRDRVGIFVPMDIEKRLNLPRINVLGSDPKTTHSIAFADRVSRITAKRKRFGNLLQIGENKRDMDQAVRMLGQLDVPSIVMMSEHVSNRVLGQAMLGHSNVMLVGYDLSAMGIHSVLCDDAAAARMATSLLQEQGHQKIAFLTRNPSSPITQQMISGYESCQLDQSLIWPLRANTKPDRHCVEQIISEQMQVGGLSCSAIICSDVPLANTLVEVLRAFGMTAPEQVSRVALGFAIDASPTHSRLTCIDPQFEKQVDYAVDSCLQWMQNKSVELLYKVQPKLVPGNSVAKFK